MMTRIERADRLSRWIQPSSDSEQQRQERAVGMIEDAIKNHSAFSTTDLRVYAKGSYANNTNVRLDSDVDVVVECHDCFYSDFVSGILTSPTPTVPYEGLWSPTRWRAEVTLALTNWFGQAAIKPGAVALLVQEQPNSRPSADVVPSFLFRRYQSTDKSRFLEGSAVYTSAGARIVNWPQQQLENGRSKNVESGQRYKRFVRVLKNAENLLVTKGELAELPSYLMECLFWNVPNLTLSLNDLDTAFGSSLAWLAQKLASYNAAEWWEPNMLKPLFGPEQKWALADAKLLVLKTQRLMGYI